jgi:DNA-binding GntR family transcriptional regulator
MRSEEIADRIANAILQHRLLPGAKLNERDLARIFDVSRTLIRQALIRLARGKLVTIEPNKSAYVSRPTLEEAHYLFDALITMEKAFIEAVVPKLTAEDIATLHAHTEQQRQAKASGNHQLANELGIQFHTVLARMVRNPVLEEMHSELMSRQRIITAIYKTDFDYCKLHDDHHVLADLIAKGATKRAQKLLESHYRLVIKGYLLDEIDVGTIDLASALAP